MSKLRWTVVVPLLFFQSASFSAPPEVTLQVAVSGIERADGVILVAACNREDYLAGECKYGARAPAQLGRVVVTLSGLPEGTYAIKVLHDLDGDGVLKRTALGLPSEPVGFGNDAQVKWGPPSFEQSAVKVSGSTVAAITLRNR